MRAICYNQVMQAVTAQKFVDVNKACNGFTVINNGTTIVLVNNLIPVQPGGFYAIGGNYGELYKGRIDISFQVPVPAPATITNDARVVQKIYMDGGGFDNPLV